MGKTVLISGGSSGLGLALAQSLSARGYRVFAGYLHHLPEKSGSITFIKLDVTSDNSCRSAAAEVKSLDVLVNCAGRTVKGPALQFSSADFVSLLDVNLVGPFRLAKACTGLLPPGGKIINVTSLNSFLSLPDFGLYSASRFALEALGFALRFELAPRRIFVTNFAPGAFSRPAAPPAVSSGRQPLREKFPFINFLLPITTQSEIVASLVRVVESSLPPLHVRAGRDSRLLYYLQKYSPDFILHRLIKLLWQLPG